MLKRLLILVSLLLLVSTSFAAGPIMFPDLVNDTTPQLGGTLDLNGNNVTLTNAGSMTLGDGTNTFLSITDQGTDATFRFNDHVGIGVAPSTSYPLLIDGGNVGIGTATPHNRLEIVGPGDSTDVWNLNKGTGTGGIRFTFDGTNYVSYIRTTESSTLTSNYMIFGVSTGNNTTGAEVMRLRGAGSVGIGTTNPVYKLDVDGAINSRLYYWVEEFDEEAAAVQFESGLRADEWVTAGTNYAAANVTYTAGVGGTMKAMCANADNDSVTILGLPNINVSQNPIMSFRIKIDTKETAAFYVGFVSAAFADVNGAFPNDAFLVGINSDNGHGFGATRIVSASVDAGAAVDYDDMGVAIVSNTYIRVKFDLTDTEQPRVWINDTEVAAGSITGTVQDAVALSPYIMVQNLAGGAIQRFTTIDFIKTWQDRG